MAFYLHTESLSTDYLLGLDNVRRADLPGLSEKEIKIIESLAEVFSENKK